MNFKYAKIVVYTPLSHTNVIRETLASCGAGNIGGYDSCSFSTKGVGRFRGRKGTKPYIGKAEQIEEVEEEKIETICEIEKIDYIINKIKQAHPYEEPAIDIYPLLNS